VDGRLAKRLQREADLAAASQARAVRRHERLTARRERAIARARRNLPVHGTAALASAALAVPLGHTPLIVTWVCGIIAARAAVTLRHPPEVPALPTARAAAAPPPPRGSSAWPAVVRLEQVRDELVRLVPLVGPAGQEAAHEAWYAAAEADSALRWQAARLGAVEPYRGPDPELLASLLDGVGRQERLVVAMADLVAASDVHLPGASLRLQDATDALHGLAEGLRALR
jgi:hypothetical protein